MSPSLAVTGLAVPYGLPRLFMQTTKKRDRSKALPSPPSSGPHQSLTSALPVKAWQITIALSPLGDSLPLVVYATGTFWSLTPDSRVKEGMTAICWSGIKLANGFSACELVLSWTYSVTGLAALLDAMAGLELIMRGCRGHCTHHICRFRPDRLWRLSSLSPSAAVQDDI